MRERVRSGTLRRQHHWANSGSVSMTSDLLLQAVADTSAARSGHSRQIAPILRDSGLPGPVVCEPLWQTRLTAYWWPDDGCRRGHIMLLTTDAGPSVCARPPLP